MTQFLYPMGRQLLPREGLVYPSKAPQSLPWLVHGFALSSQGQSRTMPQPRSPLPSPQDPPKASA